MDALVGTIFVGRYEILSVLGKGGMSVVYRATHTMMQRDVAIKMMLSHYQKNPKLAARFQQEAQSASRLNHPNLITVFDFGVTEDETYYLVMDYVEGRTLMELIDDDAPLPIDLVMKILIQTGCGLVHAHEAGIIHRDLKPGNILVQDRDGEPLVKLVDFGFAKMLPREGSAIQQLTQTGEIFGTTLYMSPEQCLGERVDRRSDIYSFGCVMFECLIGLPPFVGKEMLVTLQMHISDPVPSFKDARPDLNIPAELEEIVGKCLEKSPLDRFQSMEELLAALEAASVGLHLNPSPGAGSASLNRWPALRDDSVSLSSLLSAEPEQRELLWDSTNASPLVLPPMAGAAVPPSVAATPGAMPASAPAPLPLTTPFPVPGGVAPRRLPVYAIAGATAVVLLIIGVWIYIMVSAVVEQPPGPLPAPDAGPSTAGAGRPAYSEKDEETWENYYQVGKNAYSQGEFATAEQMFKAAENLARKFDAGDSRLLLSLKNLSELYHKQGRSADAQLLDQEIAHLKAGPRR